MNHLISTISEKNFQAQVVQLAKLCGYEVYHTFDSRRSAAGFPDLVMVKNHHLVFAELKRQDGRLSMPQKQWLEALSRVEKVSSHLWRPSDWQTLEAVLLRGR
jgi:hypothetical protein